MPLENHKLLALGQSDSPRLKRAKNKNRKEIILKIFLNSKECLVFKEDLCNRRNTIPKFIEGKCQAIRAI